MVAFQLDNTLSEFGSVTRGLCTLNGDKLESVIETGGLRLSKKWNAIRSRYSPKWQRASFNECVGFYT